MNGELLFSLYLPSTDQEPTFEHFVNEISIRRFLPFTDCFFLLRVVSFCFHAPRDCPESKATFVSQVVNREFKIRSLRTTDYGNTRRGPGSRFTAHAR